MAKNKSRAKNSAATRAIGVGCLGLFALPFAAGGTFVLYLAIAQAWNWQAARSWVEQPATLLAAKLDVRHGDDGGRSYKATARYEYRYQGLRYESERVGFSEMADNIGPYQERRGRELEKLLAAGGATVCYVDPSDPAKSVLYRDLRPELVALKSVFAASFCLVGYGLLFGAWYAARKQKREAKARAAQPDEPWRWREEWLGGRIASSSHHKAIGVTVFAVLWNLISWPAIIGVLMKEDREWWLPLLVGIFPLVGTAMAIYAVKLWRGYWRWGRSEFEMAAVPGVLGGSVAGVIHGPPAIEPIDGFRVTLSCIRRVEEGSGDNRRTVDRVLWSDERLLARPLAADAAETVLPVQFHAPYQQPATNLEDVLWKLTVHAKTKGVDYDAEFEVPVFETADSSPDEPAASDAADPLAAYELPQTTAMMAERMGARLEYEGPDETSLYFPMAHNRGMTAGLTLFAIMWTCICVGLFYSDAPRFFPWVFSAFGALIDWAALALLFTSTRLKFGPRGVSKHRRWLMFGQPREIAADEVAAVRAEFSGTTSGSTRYQRVVLRTNSRETIRLVNNIASQPAAKKLASMIRAAVGLPDDATEGKVRRSRGPGAVSLESSLPDELN